MRNINEDGLVDIPRNRKVSINVIESGIRPTKDVEGSNWIQPVVKTRRDVRRYTRSTAAETKAKGIKENGSEGEESGGPMSRRVASRRVVAETTLKWFRQKWHRRMSERFIAGLTRRSDLAALGFALHHTDDDDDDEETELRAKRDRMRERKAIPPPHSPPK